MKSILSYNDFRQYLEDFYQQQKRETHGFSFETFSTEAGIKSPNYLKLVIQGKRNLTTEATFKFAKALQLF